MWSIPLSLPLPILWSEMFDVITASYYAYVMNYHHNHIFCDNQPVIAIFRSLKGYTLPTVFLDCLYFFKLYFNSVTVSYVCTDANTTDFPSRFHLPALLRKAAHAQLCTNF